MTLCKWLSHPKFCGLIIDDHGKGKSHAVRKRMSSASGEIFMIVDADLTVPPEDLPRFNDTFPVNKGEIINGERRCTQWGKKPCV